MSERRREEIEGEERGREGKERDRETQIWRGERSGEGEGDREGYSDRVGGQREKKKEKE